MRPLDRLRLLPDVMFHEELTCDRVADFEKRNAVVLPREHVALLQETNGIEAYGGYVRLFGLRGPNSIDAITWNDRDCWKFAWANRCADFWCFGESAWGDQYAYCLRPGGFSKVYFLDALTMTPQVIAESFVEFLENEFIRSAENPYDVMTGQARQALGTLSRDQHLAYVPSILLGGTEAIECVRKMDARSAMVCNGDIALQLDSAPHDKCVAGVHPFKDELGRMRLRIIWK